MLADHLLLVVVPARLGKGFKGFTICHTVAYDCIEDKPGFSSRTENAT